MFVAEQVVVGSRRVSSARRRSNSRLHDLHSTASSGDFAVPQQHTETASFVTEMQPVESTLSMYDANPFDDVPFFEKEYVNSMVEGEHLTLRRRLAMVFEGVPHRRDAALHVTVNVVIVVAIALSSAAFCVQTLPTIVAAKSGAGIDLSPLFWVDASCIAVFVVELLLRTWACSINGFRSVFDGFYVIDLVTVLGWAADVLLDAYSDSQGGVAVVRILRLFRVFRVFKLSRYSKSLQLVVVVLLRSATGLTILLIPILMIMVIFSSLIYFIEVSYLTWDPTVRVWRNADGTAGDIQSIPDALWLTAATITTVGFGDVVPSSALSQFIVVLACFLGILILSFPNIVLGGNLQYAFRSFYRERARKYLGKKFRKVLHVVVFCKTLQRLYAERLDAKSLLEHPQEVVPPPPAVDDGDAAPGFVGVGDDATTNVASPSSISRTATAAPLSNTPLPGEPQSFTALSGSLRIGRVGLPNFSSPGSLRDPLFQSSRRLGNSGVSAAINYLAPRSELDFFRREGVPDITADNIRSWSLGGLYAVQLLRRLLEHCSGVGTILELHRSFAASGTQYHSNDIALTALHLMASEYMQVFVFRRGSTNMLCSLTPKGCAELLLHHEEGSTDCIRSIDTAKLLWKRTTNTAPTFSLQLLISNYVFWAATEKLVDNAQHTAVTDLKQVFWSGGDSAGGGGGGGAPPRRSRLLATPTSPDDEDAARPSPTHGDVELADAKATLRAVLQKQRDRILELQDQLSSL